MILTDSVRRALRASAISAGIIATPVAAQMVQPLPGTVAARPADTLSSHLRTLASNPRDRIALLGAGHAALDAGDPNAALGFFSRADEIFSADGRAKAGLGAALVQLEKPDDALRLFSEAVSLGVPEATIAGDRGLAYDLRGDNRRAQQDYALALRSRSDDEITRRYALSQAISGDRNQALATLDPLLRKQDKGAWRARAFILAVTKDVDGANIVARQVMPAALATSMSPFLSRLARLNPADQAHAVNFGTMPIDGQSYASVETGDPYRRDTGGPARSDAGLIPTGEPLGRRTTVRPLADAKTATVVPKAAPATAPVRTATRLGTRLGPVDPARLPPELRPDPPVKASSPIAPALTRDDPVVVGPPAEADRPAFEIAAKSAPAPVSVPLVVRAPDPKPQLPAARPANRLASILDGIQPESETPPAVLPTLPDRRAAQKLAAKKAADAAAAATVKADKEAKAKELAAARANPARLWVQVATGSNVKGLTTTWNRIHAANTKALKGLSGYSMPYKASNRILAGPVKSATEARTLVNALAKNGLSATTFSSEAGQEVTRLATK